MWILFLLFGDTVQGSDHYIIYTLIHIAYKFNALW